MKKRIRRARGCVKSIQYNTDTQHSTYLVGFIDLFLETGERHDAFGFGVGLSGFVLLDSN
jgi:hypothetical protein